jgi:hypothetical protein
MEETMQRNLSATQTDLPLPRADDRRNRVTVTTVATDPAEFFRRLDGRPPRRPMWMTAVAIGVLAVVATGGAVAYYISEEPSPAAPPAPTLLMSPGK